MKRIIASLAFVLWLNVSFVANAQERADETRTRSGHASRGPRTGIPSRWRGSPSERRISTASHEEVVHVDGEVILEDGYYEDPVAGCDSCGGGGCGDCGVSANFCDGCNAPNRFCICFPAHGWVHAEYLNWYADGMRLPAMVSTSTAGTARTAAGVLGQPATSVLYGANDDILSDSQSGFRIRFGWWLANFAGWGIEGEYAGLGEERESFFQQSTGTPILARPFFNVDDGAEDAELVAFPGVVTGSIAVDTTTQFDGAAFRFRRQLCSSSGCGYSEICCTTVPTSSRLDGSIGYRFWELDESLQTREQLQLQSTSQPGSFDIIDRFATRNQFNGVELGFLWQGRRGWWSLDALMRLGIGNMHQTMTISGSTDIVDNGTASSFATGFLAQRTNIGTYDRDRFTMIPELGLTLGYQMTRRVRATMGYSVIYMGNVIRPGDQVSLDVNPNLLAPELSPFTGALRPQFQFNETDYWIQGLSFGAEFRW